MLLDPSDDAVPPATLVDPSETDPASTTGPQPDDTAIDATRRATRIPRVYYTANGWSLGVPSIARRTERELPRYWDAVESDTFVLAGAEDLVPLREGGERIVREGTYDEEAYNVYPYWPRVEGAFVRIERWVRKSDGDTRW